MSLAVGTVAIAVVVQAGIIVNCCRKGIQVTGEGNIVRHDAIKVERHVHDVVCTGTVVGALM